MKSKMIEKLISNSGYVSTIRNEAHDELTELKRLAEIGRATEWLLSKSQYPMAMSTIEQIDCTQGGIVVTDTDNLIDLYNGLSEAPHV